VTMSLREDSSKPTRPTHNRDLKGLWLGMGAGTSCSGGDAPHSPRSPSQAAGGPECAQSRGVDGDAVHDLARLDDMKRGFLIHGASPASGSSSSSGSARGTRCGGDPWRSSKANPGREAIGPRRGQKKSADHHPRAPAARAGPRRAEGEDRLGHPRIDPPPRD